MEYVACNLCGIDDSRIVYSMPDSLFHTDEWFNVVECRRCGLGYVNPRPESTKMDRYYPNEYYDYFDHEDEFHRKRYAEEAAFLPVPTNGRNRLLDIGCANGDFPRFMMPYGWQVEGVEISPNAKPISDFMVYRKPIDQMQVSDPGYDVITAWAVLEHVHDPLAYFEKVSQLLQQNGLFIFLVTNFESISSRYLFREDVPRHLYFFTEDTIREYLELAGMEPIKIDYSNKIYEMRPVSWLRYYIHKLILKREMKWEDIPDNRITFFEKHGLRNNLFSSLRYLVTSPLSAVDRLTMPLYEWFQIQLNRYGNVIYVARKR